MSKNYKRYRMVLLMAVILLSSGCSRCSEVPKVDPAPVQDDGASRDEGLPQQGFSEEERFQRLEDADAQMMKDEDNISDAETSDSEDASGDEPLSERQLDEKRNQFRGDQPGPAKENEDRD